MLKKPSGPKGPAARTVAAARDEIFVGSINSACNSPTISADFAAVCNGAGLDGNSVPVGAATALNLGVAGAAAGSSSSPGAGTGMGSGMRRSVSGRSGSTDSGSGAGSDDSNRGLLVAPLYGKSDRINSSLETGYRSELRGIALGLDYAFSDNVITGAVLGTTQDQISFDGNVGSVGSDSNSLTLYATWVLDEYHSLDAYVGIGSAEFTSKRDYAIGSPVISGTAISSSNSSQTLVGVGYYRNFQLRKAWTVHASVNVDYVESDTDAYSETGGKGFDLSFPEQNTESLTSTLGLRFSYPKAGLIPTIHVAAVHEFKADARQIDVRLALNPATVVSVVTDIPDRGYLLAGFGLVGMIENGGHWFVNYEERFEHDFLDSWALGAGFVTIF